MTDGTRTRGQRLYPLVFVASLTLVALSCISLAWLGRDHVIAATIDVAAADDQAVVRGFVAANLTASDLDGGIVANDRRAVIEPLLAQLRQAHRYQDIALVSARDGLTVVATSEPGATVQVASLSASALSSGQANAWLTSGDDAAPSSGSLVEAIPVVRDGVSQLVFQIRRDSGPLLARASSALRDVVVVTLAAALVLAVLLWAIFRAANSRLRKQEAEIAEARRRDPVTGLLNHAAAVNALTDSIEVARADNSSIGIALVDIDNFRLLNDVHGSAAGDQALSTVARAFRAEAEGWDVLARFGPDEFLAIAPKAVARNLPAASQRLRERLADRHVDVPGSDPLPLTVSVGIAYFPFHAGSVTDLISAATTALADAKAGGGNDMSIADAWTDGPRTAHSTFDVLQGLVLAIDRKDRYTKLHSEDVAAYALFLADRLGLPEETKKRLRIAALLHDVGKIGVPDDILRKPGRLTPYEYEIVKQHVALGDLLVRDVPDVDQIRDGVRYHHERWDGEGYLLGLAGENIPMIARILAVADAFSAMTTSRPYRKALPAERALEELRAVAGTQLDGRLVHAFVAGMELDPNAPLPGAFRSSDLLWNPDTQAA